MNNSVATLADGRRLAIAMLREFRDVKPEECSCEDHFRAGRKQRDLFGKYLELLRESGADVRAGFCIIMNDFLAAANDVATDVQFYETLEAEGYDRNAVYFQNFRLA